MDKNKITYTVSWTEHPKNWNIPGAVKLLESVRQQLIQDQHKKLEEISFRETQELIARIKCQK